ncbi:hypothetical protein BSKO_13624 [Bryopsis sp. KO-2023]|nr:hypothetical protein BSKO_13624 [Bryopsis sp. KO-2023]
MVSLRPAVATVLILLALDPLLVHGERSTCARVIGSLANVALTPQLLTDLDGNVQFLVDCLDPGANLTLDVNAIQLKKSLILEQSVHVRSNFNRTTIRCPPEEKKSAVVIQSDNVMLSSLNFDGCRLNSSTGFLHVKKAINIHLSDIKCQGNFNPKGPGCLSIEDSDVHVHNSQYDQNRGLSGGAISITKSSRVAVRDSTFKSNVALKSGGAIFCSDSDLEMSNSRFEDNQADASGGAIHGKGSDEDLPWSGVIKAQVSKGGPIFRLRITNSTFSGNQVAPGRAEMSALPAGGAIAVTGLRFRADIDKGLFLNNSVNGVGGAIAVSEGSDISIFRTHLTMNYASQGGAVHINSSNFYPSTADFLDSVFLENYVKQALPDNQSTGGAIALVGDKVRCTIDSVSFKENRSPISGGGLFSLGNSSFDIAGVSEDAARPGQILMIDTKFQENSVSSNTSGEGGALFISGLQANITKTRFIHNKGQLGGAIYMTNMSESSIEKTSLVENTAVHGGAVFAQESLDVNLRSSNLKGNRANNGGGLFLQGCRNTVLEELLFEGNWAAIDGGGMMLKTDDQELHEEDKLFLRSPSDGHVFGHDLNFTSNAAKLSGGGIAFMGGAALQLENAWFEHNEAERNGGAMWLGGSATEANLTNTKVKSNRARNGGGLAMEGGSVLNVSASAIEFNNAVMGGGGIYTMHGEAHWVNQKEESVLRIRDSTFTENTAGNVSTLESGQKVVVSAAGQGGGLMLSGGGASANMHGVEFSGNVAGVGGGVCMVRGSAMFSKGCTYIKNEAITGGAMALFELGRFQCIDVLYKNNNAQEGGAVSATYGNREIFQNLLIPLDEGRNVFRKAIFVGNSAFQGGGMNIYQHQIKCIFCAFRENRALRGGASGGIVEGGAVRMKLSFVEIYSSDIGYSEAERGGGLSIVDSLAVILNVSISDNVAEEDGGGISARFTSLFTTMSGVPVSCDQCFIERNQARLGGGIHVLMNRTPFGFSDCTNLTERASTSSQQDYFKLLETCRSSSEFPELLKNRRVVLRDTTISNNNALDSGAAIFSNQIDNLEICCGKSDCDLSELTPAGNPCPEFKVGNSSHATQGGLWVNNTINGAPAKFALGTSIENVFIQPSIIEQHSSGNDLKRIYVELQDSFGELVPMKMTLTVRSTEPDLVEVSGSPVEGVQIRNGAYVSGVMLSALPGTYNLTFQFVPIYSGGATISKEVTVSVRKCKIGEVSEDNGLRCIPCKMDYYSFNTNEGCRACPMNAVCNGSTLVPIDGFWQATSQSVHVQRCMFDKSCSYPNRTTMLVEAANNTKRVGWEEGYPLCAQGYTGLLCGSCKKTYGKLRSLECGKCQGKLIGVLLLSALLAWFLVLSAVFIKSSMDYSKDEAELIPVVVEEEKEEETPKSHAEFKKSSDDQALADANQDSGPAEISVDEHWSNSGQIGAARGLERTVTNPAEVLKVLMNFIQVTSVAASINAGWTEGMLKMLGFLDTFSGASDSSGLVPLDCIFTSADDSHTFRYARSIKTFTILSVYPFALWSLLALFWGYRKFRNGLTVKELRTRCLISLLAVLYVTYTDVAKRMARIFNCVGVEAEGNGRTMTFVLLRVSLAKIRDLAVEKQAHVDVELRPGNNFDAMKVMAVAGVATGKEKMTGWKKWSRNRVKSLKRKVEARLDTVRHQIHDLQNSAASEEHESPVKKGGDERESQI